MNVRRSLCVLALAFVGAASAGSASADPCHRPAGDEDPCEHGNSLELPARPAARQREGLLRARQRREERGHCAPAPIRHRRRLRHPHLPATPTSSASHRLHRLLHRHPAATPPPASTDHSRLLRRHLHRRRQGLRPPPPPTATSAASATPTSASRPPPPPPPPLLSSTPGPEAQAEARPKPTPERCFVIKLNVKAFKADGKIAQAPGHARARPDQDARRRSTAGASR